MHASRYGLQRGGADGSHQPISARRAPRRRGPEITRSKALNPKSRTRAWRLRRATRPRRWSFPSTRPCAPGRRPWRSRPRASPRRSRRRWRWPRRSPRRAWAPRSRSWTRRDQNRWVGGGPTCWIRFHLFLWRSHKNMNTGIHLVNPVYDRNSYTFMGSVFIYNKLNMNRIPYFFLACRVGGNSLETRRGDG